MPHKSLRQGRTVYTPAIALGLTDHVWSYREYIWLPVHADPVLTKQMDERLVCLLTPALQEQPKGSRQEKSSAREASAEQEEAAPTPKAA